MEFAKKAYYFILDSVQTLLIAGTVFLLIYIFIARPFQVSGLSMFPNFHDKEYVLTNIIGLQFSEPKLGDVVVIDAPNDAEKHYIKRVIGTPGDTIMISNGHIILNGKQLDESKYIKSDIYTTGGAFLQENQPYTVQEQEYFVIGDNRPYSSDSREFGPVIKNKIIGKSFFVYWPVNQMRFVENPYN